jgi:KaiC/GvpD/RAD55 family RecA-like ATPase/PKD repeat protein
MPSRLVSLSIIFVVLVLVGALGSCASALAQEVYPSFDTNLLVFAEASSFARLDDIDPSGWFFQAVLYNPGDSPMVVTGLRWAYVAVEGEDFVDGSRNARCYDLRYFSDPPTVLVPTSGNTTVWEYAIGTISLTAPPKTIIVPWIEVPTYSRNSNGTLTAYFVQAYANGEWITSPPYFSHSGHDLITSTIFRIDFDLATDPNDEQQEPHPPEWLFNEDRCVAAGSPTRVRLIPITSSRNTLGIDCARVNVMLPSGWTYVPGSAFNLHSENITLDSVDGKDMLKWELDTDVLRYSSNPSMTQNYIEFNVTAPYVPGVHNFTVTSTITSLVPEPGKAMTSWENQFIYVVVKTPPNATFKSSPKSLLTGKNVTFNATNSYDADGQIESYFWDFGDGLTGTGNIATHAYADNGTYTVKLTTTDNDGLKDTAQDTIIVQNRSPFAQFTESASTGYTGETIYFNASDSYDPDGHIIDFFWDFGDRTNATGMTAIHTYIEDGNYTVELTVTDDDKASMKATGFKTILNRGPVASFVIVPQQTTVGTATLFNASNSYDLDGTILSYTWNFGNGNITTVTNPTVTHSYNAFGNYSVILNVTDNDDFYDSSKLTLTVHNVDLAIIDVIVSASEIYVGQTLNVSVVVRNEGTRYETFNVTLYYDGTAIGTKTVDSLQPETEATLKFSWNTTDVAPGISYWIKAETNGIIGETDSADNSYIYGALEIRNQGTPFDWSSIFPYAIPILLGGMVFLATGILRKKRETGEGFEFFNELTGGGIPDAYSVMITGDAGSGKSVLGQQLTHEYLKQRKSCVYVTYDIFPSELRQNMKSFNWNPSPYEQKGTFILIDCYSSTAGLDSKEKYHVDQPFALSDLGIAISTAMHEAKQKSPRVFLDSTAPLFARVDVSKVAEFLQDRIAKIKGDKGVFLFTVGKGTVPSGSMQRLEEIVDGIIELDVYEEKGKTWKRMRVRKLRGRKVTDTWIPFKIELKKGITFLPPKAIVRRKES